VSNIQSIPYFTPEIILLVTMLAIILFDIIPSLKKWVQPTSLIGILITAYALYATMGSVKSIFFGMIVVDPFSHMLKWIILLTTFAIIFISKYSNELDDSSYAEYNTLLIAATLGLFLMTSSTNLLMIYIAIELVSIPSYILAGIMKGDAKSNESALKYVIFGSFASGVMLFGISWLYGISGSTDIFVVHDAILNCTNPVALYISFIMILVGFGYKISMVPFHYWTPDVYEGSPTTITAFLSVAPKVAGFALIIRVFSTLFSEGGEVGSLPVAGFDWALIIAVLSALTMTIGNLLALQQNNVKRMLAYSSISHVGFMLMAYSVLSKDAMVGIIFYLVIYAFMNLGAFFFTIFANNKVGSVEIDSWNGLGKRNPVLSAFMVLVMVSLAGLPPTSGFVGKVYLFSALFSVSKYYWLAIVGILNSVVALYYYFRVVKSMYFENNSDTSKISTNPVVFWMIIVFSIQSILFYFYWSPLYVFIQNTIELWK